MNKFKVGDKVRVNLDDGFNEPFEEIFEIASIRRGKNKYEVKCENPTFCVLDNEPRNMHCSEKELSIVKRRKGLTYREALVAMEENKTYA